MLKSPVIMILLLFSSVDKVVENSSMKCFIFLLHDLGGLSIYVANSNSL